MRIVTADIAFDLADVEAYHEQLIGAEGSARRRGWKARAQGVTGPIGGPRDIDATAAPAVAYVNEGRWVADCPSEGCTGAIILFPAPAGFLCAGCFNGEIGHRYRPVTWPAERSEIEAALVERPVPATRNWSGRARPGWGLTRGETVDDLAAENVARGVRQRFKPVGENDIHALLDATGFPREARLLSLPPAGVEEFSLDNTDGSYEPDGEGAS